MYLGRIDFEFCCCLQVKLFFGGFDFCLLDDEPCLKNQSSIKWGVKPLYSGFYTPKAVTYHEPTVMWLFMIGHSPGRMETCFAPDVFCTQHHDRSQPWAYGDVFMIGHSRGWAYGHVFCTQHTAGVLGCKAHLKSRFVGAILSAQVCGVRCYHGGVIDWRVARPLLWRRRHARAPFQTPFQAVLLLPQPWRP